MSLGHDTPLPSRFDKRFAVPIRDPTRGCENQ